MTEACELIYRLGGGTSGVSRAGEQSGLVSQKNIHTSHWDQAPLPGTSKDCLEGPAQLFSGSGSDHHYCAL